MSPAFQALNCWKKVLTHVGVGMGAASFWRGAWYVLDDQLFPEDPNMSAMASLALGTGGMAASQGIVARAMAVQRPILKPIARFGALYTIAMSCVLVWRGTWVGWDCVYEHFHNEILSVSVTSRNTIKSSTTQDEDETEQEARSDVSLMATSSMLDHSPAGLVIKSTDPGHLTTSGLASHLTAIAALGACGVFASVLAPPAAVSVIKDLAIKVSGPAARRRTGTTTTYFKTAAAQRSREDRAFEFVPHLAAHLKPANAPTSRSMATSARGFQSATRAWRN